MINFIKKLFRKKPYTFLGRAGISFNNGENDFYIDTSEFLSKGREIEIFYEAIKFMDSSGSLTDLEKKKIAVIVKKLLEEDNYYVIISPPVSVNFVVDNS